ncbi:xanthine dehydrogenase accessory protein XdhC [Martelella alba]|uniref:Xanthine dehydrogenase accessory protein XdhC n=1 Tax=Martelella alba TaxID=2590451 RepID=A0A506UGY7_9HYPH|nr:xanthine dehydrogenase accessory protein XdhC [Martelella alba]TPW31657.1 xanthine dehydrogenase accessory protein XdhC [Martelella alba]
MITVDGLTAWIAREAPAVMVTIAGVKGSSPREQGAYMLVSKTELFGTIGGGQLEFIAINHARRLLGGADGEHLLDIPLGPEIGQCCGGRIALSFAKADEVAINSLAAQARAESAGNPHVAIFGGGHVGAALATALAPLPMNVRLVETRAETLKGLPDAVTPRLVAVPEAEIAALPPGSAVVILTHDHALDFLIAVEALKRGDLAYCGMVGSKTKRATFASHAREAGLSDASIANLVLPIGGAVVRDKRPEVIAAMVAAELLTVFSAAS